MIAALSHLALAAPVVASDPALVNTTNGPVRGLVTHTWRSFRGIPFAEPPLGKLRWSPPVVAASWQAPLDATQYKHNCVQKQKFDPYQPRATLSEDCLYLNVFTPANATAASKLPVLFWVHGGGYQGGGANESRLNGTFDAALGDMVVVVANYRLNVFGFLGAKELRGRDAARGTTGNYGILDQRAALQWVRANVDRFGGDASRVLLVGESAGGASVHNHLVRPASWGLFSSAGIESGGYTLVYPQPAADDFEAQYAPPPRAETRSLLWPRARSLLTREIDASHLAGTRRCSSRPGAPTPRACRRSARSSCSRRASCAATSSRRRTAWTSPRRS